MLRAMLSGPVDTPYAHGLFLFDIFLPDTYPNTPPLVKFLTTGLGSTTRFNPNLYNDGKVCLSLLGTWHAAADSEKWDPARSTLYQVLVSIQALILVEEPYFNEPGMAERTPRGTSEGDRANKLYNDTARVATVKFSMLDALQNPPLGFEGAVRAHFLRTRAAVMADAKRWTAESEPGSRAALEADVGALAALLGALTP